MILCYASWACALTRRTIFPEFGHVGQQDQMISIIKGMETGQLADGDLMVMVAAGTGYAWGASVVVGINADRVAVSPAARTALGGRPVLLFARAGAAVAVWDTAAEAGQAVVAEITAAGGQAAFFRVNVTVQAEVEAAARRWPSASAKSS